MADAKRENGRPTEQEFTTLANVIQEAHREKAELEARVEQLEVLLHGLIKGIDDWNEDVQRVIGRIPDYHWGTLEEARRALSDLEKEEEA